MTEKHIPVGGDFSKIFSNEDYLAMINIPDEPTCILRAHLILEEVLNLWSSKLTETDNLFVGAFFSFKAKLCISKNLGLNEDFYLILDKVNKIRNRFSHRKGYTLEDSELMSLKEKVNAVTTNDNIHNCEDFHVFLSGKSQHGEQIETIHEWENSSNRVRFVIIFVILMLKLTYWLQNEFNTLGIPYTIISLENN